ncbi:MAG: methyl-accepting chemotaxis protein [Treponema sp.]|nr:methyl-accepting chemotaxis protein [Treponema sp.]
MELDNINKRIKADEHAGEKIVSNLRLSLAIIFVVSTTGVALIRLMQGDLWIPWRAHVSTFLFLVYSVYLSIYVRKTKDLSDNFKYISSFLDMTGITAIIWISCTYPHISPPLPFLSFRALFYSLLILAGSFRYSSRCAYISSIYAGIIYTIMIIVNRNVLDVPHFFMLNGEMLEVSFPLFYETFRVVGIFLTGLITGLANKRRLNLFYSMIESETVLRKEMDEINQQHLSKTVDKNNQLNGVVVESFDAIEDINKHIGMIETKVQTQMQSMQAASHSAQGIFEHIASFQKTVNIQADSINESSEAVKEMVSHVDSVRSIAYETGKTAESLMQSSEEGHKMLLKLTEDIKQIGERSAALVKANETVAGIAGQTNILAMNAAIQAAHAGDAGKGFAVVAGEVRKLAELSTKESDSISLEIKKMEQVIDQIKKVSQATVASMDTIFSGIKNIGASFSKVNKAVEIHADEGTKVVGVLKTVTQTTKEVKEGSAQIYNEGTTINKEMNALDSISTELTQSVNEMKVSEKNVKVFLEKAKEIVSLQQV